MALDELLGLRGPISTLVRNLLWLLAFNATYLGIFSFVPKTVGSTIYAGLLNTTACDKILKKIPYMHSKDPEKETVLHMLSLLNAASSERNSTFRLPDLATVTLGYFSIAGMIVFMRFGWMLSQKVRQKFSLDEIHTNDEQQQHVRFHDRPRRERDDVVHEFDDRDAMEPVSTGAAVGVALDATVAVVKVGVLLFLKMFLLPLILGLWLDGSTMSLFGHTTSNRVEFAGGDLFSFILLHWVAGITFMLLVTVFLLQLREVAHPNLLARLIRPQEPQPDLLGNLMNETVGTHMKRMFLSLGIYAPLLTMHVTVPVKLFLASGLGDRITFFNLNFWHVVMPQMQIPLELIVFHLSMLALLERYKNSIGGLQHKWMVFMCRKMGLTEYLLPCSIEQFQFVGTKKIFLSRIDDKDVTDATVAKPMVEKSIVRQVDPFWYELAKKEKNIDNIVQTSAIHASIESACKFVDGDTKENGERVLADSMDFIRLPGHTSGDETLLPTKIGRFRLKCVIDNDASNSVIEFWKEVPGKEIPRPPEGWDDLGAGGAFVQRRWAWGKERKSVIEGNVAQSSPFRSSKNENFPIHLILRVACLVVFSWFAITTTILGIVSTPLAVGRSLYFLFRISNEYVHDPLAFCIGGCLFFPMMSLLFKASTCAEGDPTRRFGDWLSRFHIPPKSKLYVLLESLVLWLGVAPMTLGISYEIFAVKTSKWFAREEPVNSLILCWTVGTVVVNTWAFLAYYSVFTRDFWANIGNGILEPPLDGNGMGEVIRNNANEGDREIEGMEEDNVDELYQSWQGKRGRVARFFNVWRSVLSDWEWDAVDHVKLLEDFARPITRQLASALVGSSLSFYFSLYLVPLLARHEEGGVVGKCLKWRCCLSISSNINLIKCCIVPVIGQIDPGLFRKALFRLCMGFHIIVQLGSASRARLEGWFDAAHEAARDDRYLIGEILMNYDEE